MGGYNHYEGFAAGIVPAVFFVIGAKCQHEGTLGQDINRASVHIGPLGIIMNHPTTPTAETGSLIPRERLWFFVYGSDEMECTPDEIVAIILENGPFPQQLLGEWPEEMRKDYLEILGLDLTTMGLDEFKRMSTAIGEAYLLSLGKPIESDEVLLKSWKTISNDEQPPLAPIFNES